LVCIYSLSLLKPVVIDKIKEVISVLKNINDFFYEVVFEKAFDTEYLGVITYKQMRAIPIVENFSPPYCL